MDNPTTEDFLSTVTFEDSGNQKTNEPLRNQRLISGTKAPVEQGVRMIDNDTFVINGERVRISGINAPEVTSIKNIGDRSFIKPGAPQGASDLIYPMAADLGLTQVQRQGKDINGRTIGTLVNPNKPGSNLATEATKNFLVPITNQTSVEDIKARTNNLTAALMFPAMADRNKYLQAGLDSERKRIEKLKEAGYTQSFVPKVVASDPAEKQAYRNTFGNVAAKQYEKELTHYLGLLDDKTIPDKDRKEIEKRVGILEERLTKALSYEDMSSGSVSYLPEDRDINNISTSQKWDSLISGTKQVGLWGAGFSQMVGDNAKIEYLSNLGRKSAGNIKAELNTAPVTEQSVYDAISNNSTAWGKISSASNAVANSLVGSLPTIGVMLAGGEVMAPLAAPIARFGGVAKDIYNNSGAFYKVAGAIGVGEMAAIGATVSSLPTSLLFAGKNYEAQPEDKKDVTLALGTGYAEAIVEKLSLDLVGVKPSIFSINGRDKIAQAILAKSAAGTLEIGGKAITVGTKAEALKLLETLTKREIAQVADSAEDFARRQYMTMGSMSKGLAELSAHGTLQAGTESFQQLMEMYGQAGDPNKAFDPKYQSDFYKQLIDSAAAGFGFASAYNIPARAFNAMQWHAVASNASEFKKSLGEAQAYQAENNRRRSENDPLNPGYRSVEEMVDQERLVPLSGSGKYDNVPLERLPSERGFIATAKTMVSSPLYVIRALWRNMNPSDTFYKEDGTFKENLVKLAAIVAGGWIPGAHFARYRQNLVGQVSGVSERTLAEAAGVPLTDLPRTIQWAIDNYWKNGLSLPTDSSVTNEAELRRNKALEGWLAYEKENLKTLREESALYGVKDPEMDNDNYLFERHLINPDNLFANKNLIADEVEANGGDREQTLLAIRNLMSNNPEKIGMARNYLAKYNAFSNPKLAHLFDNNTFNHLMAMKDRVASTIAKAKYFGKNGEVLSKLLSKAWENGEFENETDFKRAVAAVQVYKEILDSNYHSMDDMPKLKKALSTLSVLTMLSSLPKAALSSLTEIPMATLGNNAQQTVKQMNEATTGFFKEWRDDWLEGANFGLSALGLSMLSNSTNQRIKRKADSIREKIEELNGKIDSTSNVSTKEKLRAELRGLEQQVQDLIEKEHNRNMFEALGFNEASYNSSARYEYNDSAAQKAMSVFAKVIGLRAQTDSNRIAAISVAADVLLNHILVLQQVPVNKRANAFSSGNGLTKEQAHALVELQQYGMDVPYALSFIESSPNTNPFSMQFLSTDFNTEALEESNRRDFEAFQSSLLTAIGNFVDSRIVNPQAHNLPKFYHDPRLRPVTLMGRFVATTMTTTLPRLYKQYLLSGNAGLTYSAFSVIAMSYIMASITNMMKDTLSYGEDSPYVKGNWKKIQRNIYSSGTIGQGEKIVELFSPLYPEKKTKFTQEPFKYAYEQAKGVSPQLNYIGRAVEGVSNIAEGKTERGVNQLLRGAPIIGGFPVATRTIASAFSEKKGEK